MDARPLIEHAAEASISPDHTREGLAALSFPEEPFADAVDALGRALGASGAVRRYINRRPEIADAILHDNYVSTPKPTAAFFAELNELCASATAGDEHARIVRRYRTQEWVRIVVRDIGETGSVWEVLRELSDLADACIAETTRWYVNQAGPALQELGAPNAAFSVLAQGKLGGRELNVSSDVDLQFLFAVPEEVEPLAFRKVQSEFNTVAQRIIQALSKRTEDGFSYRVDMNLRPEGSKGPLVNSVDGFEQYYESFGQAWERLALIRARHVGGSEWVTQEALDRVRPFIYPRTVGAGAIDEIRALRTRMEKEHRARRLRRHSGPPPTDIKRDSGAIREIELFVQILQLLHGGSNTSLRTPQLHEALDALETSNVIARETKGALVRHYEFYRRLENALQSRDEQQVHTLPTDDGELRDVARMLGMHGEDEGARLSTKVAHRQRSVRRMTASLFSDEKDTERGSRPRGDPALLALSEDPESRTSALSTLGFGDVNECSGVLASLQSVLGGPFSTHAREKIRNLASPFIHGMARSPDPDLSLRQYADLDRQLRRRPGYYDMLNLVPAQRRLFDLLGSSEFLGHIVVRYPELIDWLAHARLEQEGAGGSRFEETLAKRLEAIDDVEVALRAIRRFKLHSMLRTGLLDLAEALKIRGVMEHLTALAQTCLRSTLDWTVRYLAEKLPPNAREGFCVLALGRMGSREMGYGSDLDLVFLYDEQSNLAREDAVRLAQKLIFHVTYRPEEGPLYAIDTRLRPSGRQGPIVSGSKGFVNYHREHAQVWEHLALMRARPVAGAMELGHATLRELDDIRYPNTLAPNVGPDLRAMRERMERERAGNTPNVKLGPGGIVDIEFLAQFLVMKHGADLPQLRLGHTGDALRALGAHKVLSERDSTHLWQAYEFLRSLENRLRIVNDRPADAIDKAAMEKLARRMGYASQDAASKLNRELKSVTQSVRETFDRLMSVEGSNP